MEDVAYVYQEQFQLQSNEWLQYVKMTADVLQVESIKKT